MEHERLSTAKKVLIVILPLIALTAAGVSLFYLLTSESPEQITLEDIIPAPVSPEEYSRELAVRLPESLSGIGINPENISAKAPDSTDADIRTVYTVKVPENISLTRINVAINELSEDMGGRVFQGVESESGKTITIKAGSGRTPTDIIVLRKMRGLKKTTGVMAIIVDDLGMRNVNLARRLCDMNQVVTLSILPFQPKTFDVIQLARKTGTPYMLHMPMEPKSTKVKPGKGAIYTSDTEEDIRLKLDRAFRDVDGASGANNHMGSRVTEDLRIMETVMNYFRENGMFFVDSQTSRNSVGYSLSQKMGVKSAVLTRFIDVTDEQDFIEGRLRELGNTAIERGQVVAICHDRPNTVAVLERILPELEMLGISFVAVETLVR